MSLIKEDEYKQQIAIFQSRHEPGLQALRAWLYGRRDRINAEWPGQDGPELLRMQGEARATNKLIRLIDTGPSIKPPVKPVGEKNV